MIATGTARLLLALAAVAVLLSGCGGSDSTETEAKQPAVPREMRIVLDDYEGPETVGILMAETQGCFEDQGLFTEMTTALTPTRAVQYTVGRSTDVAVVHEPQVVLAREKSAPIVAIGSVVPQPTAAMIWLRKSGIRGIADLKGKTIAIPGVSFLEGFLEAVLARAGLTLDDVKLKRVGYDTVPPLVSGRADALFGGSWNEEGVMLESRGLNPVIRRVQGLGIPGYDEEVVIARADRVSGDPQLFRDFMAALACGTAAAIEDPEAAVEAIEESGETNPRLSPKVTKAEVEATLTLLSESGRISGEQASGLVDWMSEEGMIQRKPPVSELLTHDYLAEQP